MPDMMAMLGLKGISPITPPSPIGAPHKSAGEEFQSVFTDAVQRVEQFRLDAEQASGGFMRGEDVELHQVVLAGQRADVAFEMFLGVRNKVVSAYQEIMRMQL